MPVTISQSNATRNQSTANYTLKKIAIWNNRFLEGTFTNTTGGSFTLTPGELVVRSKTVVDGFEIATYTDGTTNNLADVIGIAIQEDNIVLANNGTVFINIVVAGGIDSTQLTFPAGVTLNTVVGNKVLKDVLNSLGMHLDESAVEHTKFEQ